MKGPSEKLKAVKESQEDDFKFPSVRALQLVPWSIFNRKIWIVLVVQWSKAWRSWWWKAKTQVVHRWDIRSKTEDRISPSTVKSSVGKHYSKWTERKNTECIAVNILKMGPHLKSSSERSYCLIRKNEKVPTSC